MFILGEGFALALKCEVSWNDREANDLKPLSSMGIDLLKEVIVISQQANVVVLKY